MSLLKKLAGETAIYGISSVLGRVLNFVIMTPYLTNVFMKGEYGVVSEMYAYAGFLMVMFTYRMETTFFRFGSKDQSIDASFSTAALSIFGTTVVFLALLVGFAAPIAQLIDYPAHKEYIVFFALIIGFDALSAIPFARLRLENKPLRFAILKLLNVAINAVAILFFLEGCPRLIDAGWDWPNLIYDAENRISYIFIANLIASLITILLLSPSFFKIKLSFDKELWKKMMRYSMPLLVVGLAGITNEVIDRPLLRRLLPGTLEENTAQMGVYSACYKLAILMALFTQAFNYAAEPFFFRNAGRADAKSKYAQVAQGFTIVGCLGFLAILLYIDIVQYLVAEEYREGLKIVPILLLANLSLGLYYNFSIWYKLTDKTVIGAYISILGAVVTLALNFMLIPKIGYIGSAWATLACYGTMTIMSYFLGQKHYPVPYPIWMILFYIALALVVYQINLLVRTYVGSGTISLFLINTGLILFYIGIVWLSVKWKKNKPHPSIPT